MTSGARCRGGRRGCKEGSPDGLGGGGAPSHARAVCRTATGRCPGHDSIPRATGRMCSGRALRERMSGLRVMPPPARGLLSPPSPRSCRRHAPLPIVDRHRADAWRSGKHPGAGLPVVSVADLRMMLAEVRAGTATGWTAGKEDGRLERLHESRSLSPGDPLRVGAGGGRHRRSPSAYPREAFRASGRSDPGHAGGRARYASVGAESVSLGKRGGFSGRGRTSAPLPSSWTPSSRRARSIVPSWNGSFSTWG